ncbi:MAG: inositol monophosphatase [Candidatus Komeilibacteria bacterium]|jgi:myo-inositol-1(or 4)-monophosphatase|nr:inositol monophosphatase [Candidatus Komeilibacteria bacterium]MBT4447489.1 inositol monophosphatase [Candidatus Komeilibacteria bacterium]
MYKKELEIAKKAARQAGKYLGKEFLLWSRGKASYKTDRELVTKCDKQAEKIIFSYIKKAFPKYAILSEESGLLDKKSDYFWVVDPLDGTTNFTNHLPIFTSSISLFYKKEVVLGVTYMPILDEMYFAVKGGGAYKNNKKLSVSKIKNIEQAIMSYNHGKGIANTKKAYKVYEHFHLNAFRCRNIYSTTLQMAMVAAGHIDGYVVSGAKLWDVAAGVIMITEAGGTLTTWQGKPWIKTSKSIICANKDLYPLVVKDMRKLRLA